MTATFKNDFLFLLHEVTHLIRTEADQKARVKGLTRAQWGILARLERHAGINQNELAAMVEVEPITVARLIDRLEARGLVERRADPRDRRVRRLHLTEAARPILADMHVYREDLDARLTAGFDAETRDLVIASLQRMKANLVSPRPETARAG